MSEPAWLGNDARSAVTRQPEGTLKLFDLEPGNHVEHYAKFTPAVLRAIADYVPRGARVLDPFAGTGLIHELDADTVGVEIEPEQANLHPSTIVGSALALPFADGSFDAVATSPAYGNRMADHHPPGKHRQRTYRQALGRALHPENTGRLQWGPLYRREHERAWAEVRRVLKPNRLFILNISNHIRNGFEQPVVQWHCNAAGVLGFELEDGRLVPTPRMGYGQNGKARVEGEWVLQFRRAEEAQ